MSATCLGRIDWSVDRDKEGHREYELVTRVLTTAATDGPATVMNAAGLPTVGSTWSFGGDSDPWAFCWPTMSVKPQIKTEPNRHWTVKQKFSTRPMQRCQDTTIEDPLAEPDRISGTFVKYLRNTEVDRNDKKIASSSHELITGIQKDDARATVTIEQNVMSLDLEQFTEMMNTVNDAELWGLSSRKVKLGAITWSRQMWGVCNYYYVRRFEFEIRFEGFDLTDIVDTGFKRYNWEKYGDVGTGHEYRDDPTKFCVDKDDNDENTPERILLNGYGSPLTDGESPVKLDPVELYDESNFLLLGIPSDLSTV